MVRVIMRQGNSAARSKAAARSRGTIRVVPSLSWKTMSGSNSLGVAAPGVAVQVPAASQQLIKKVLASLKDAGQVQLVGRGRGAVWRVIR